MKTPIALTAQRLVIRRLKRIRRDDGFNTDAGLHVFHGPISVTDEIEYAIAVQFSQEEPRSGTGSGTTRSYKIDRTATVTGVIVSDPKCERGEALEYLLADIKSALFLYEVPKTDPQNELGPVSYQSSRLVPRADGNEFESVEVTAGFAYMEGYGDPYAAR